MNRPLVALFAKPVPAVRAPLRRAMRALERAGAEVRLDAESAKLLGRRGGRTREEAVRGASLLVCLGGDGTLISAARALHGAPVPVLGINAGSLGFLTETRLEEMERAIAAALAGRLARESRLLLSARVTRDGRKRGEFLCLNDAVVAKGALARIITLQAEVDGEPLADYRADGLIVATPTGSTAYAMAVGGPIVHPAADAILLAPIAPHALSQRPLLLPGNARVRLTLLKAPGNDRDPVSFTADGQSGLALKPGDSVEIARHPGALTLLKPRGRTWFKLLREKLGWGENPELRRGR